MIAASSYIAKLISHIISALVFKDCSPFPVAIITSYNLLANIGTSLFLYKALSFPFKTSAYVVPLGFIEA